MLKEKIKTNKQKGINHRGLTLLDDWSYEINMSNLKCKNCNKKISEEDRRCPKCGVTTEKGVKENNVILVTIAAVVCIFLLIILATTKNSGENNALIGSWKSEKEFGENLPAPIKYNKFKPTYEGIKTTTYVFDKNGKCIENVSKNGTETLNGNKKPYNFETTYYYEYKINGNLLTLFDYEYYKEDMKNYNECIQHEECDMEQPIKSEYEEEYTIIISDTAIFIDDIKYDKV